MIIKEFGLKNTDIAIMLHGGGLSWWNYKEVSTLLVKKGYHVVIPILDGHAQSDHRFTSIEDNAKEIITYIDQRFSGHVRLIAGLSLGGQTLVEILSERRDICNYAVIESALVIPMKVTHALIASSVSMSYPLIKKPWFAKMQFKNLRMRSELYEDYFRDTCLISKQDMISFLKANSSYQLKDTLQDSKAKALIMVGKKEQRKMINSARKLNQLLSGSKLIEFDGWYHGDASINHSEEYVRTILSFMEKEGSFNGKGYIS